MDLKLCGLDVPRTALETFVSDCWPLIEEGGFDVGWWALEVEVQVE
jgi:hypothetical protein